MEKEVAIDGIGKVVFKVNKRSKYYRLNVEPFKGVRVSMPRYGNYGEAKRMVEKNREWVRKQLRNMRKLEKSYVLFDENVKFETRYRKLVVREGSSDKPKYRINERTLVVEYPVGGVPNRKSFQDFVKKAIEETYRIEAKEYLPKRVKVLARRFNLSYKSLTIRNSKTRWGSCSVDNRINLSLYLMKLPDKLIDYVILHELAHTLFKNHGKNFWRFLDILCPNAIKIDRELRKFNSRL